jgi:aspartyl-tRNA(Asn)/glutamyl-tRNA(Gln) amidotransferase subunit B
MVGEGAEPKAAANWFINEYLGQLSNFEGAIDVLAPVETPTVEMSIKSGSSARSGQITINWTAPGANTAIVRMITSNDITGKSAKALLGLVIEIGPAADSEDVRMIAERLNLKQVTDMGAIEKAVDDIVAANPDKAAQVRAKPQMIGWFVGQVMKASDGKVNPQAVNDLLKTKLGL